MKFVGMVMWLFLLAGCFSIARAQPGDESTFIVEVIDKAGKPIRDASVDEGFVGFIRSPFSTAVERGFKQLFMPTDGESSSFVAEMHCVRRGGYSIKVSAQGFHPAVKKDVIRSCPEVVKVVLESNGETRPKFEKLAELSGKLTNNLGQPVVYGLKIFFERFEYAPKVAANGTYSIKLKPGEYRIQFKPYDGCAEFELNRYPIGAEDKVLDFKTECKR